MAGVIAGLAAAPSVPTTIAARPETIDALLGSPEPGLAELVDALRTAVAGRTVLDQTYVEVSPDSLVPAGLFGEINEQTASGRAVLTDELGAEPVGSVALSPPDLGAAGMVDPRGPGRAARRRGELAARTARRGDHQLLPRPTLRARAPRGDVGRAAAAVDLQAFATDPVVLERLTTDGSPGLVASRVLAELALLRLEQPSVARSMILPLDRSTRGDVVRLLLDGIGAGRPFAPMTLDEAFDHADSPARRWRQPGGAGPPPRHPRDHHGGGGQLAAGRESGPRDLRRPRRPRQPQRRSRSAASCSWPWPPT